jgi:hypothetical protein
MSFRVFNLLVFFRRRPTAGRTKFGATCFLLAASVVVASPPRLPRQVATGTLEGRVVWNDAELPGIGVRLCEVERRIEDGKKAVLRGTGRPMYDGCTSHRDTTTGEEGTYVFEDVTPGDYIVMARSGNSWVFMSPYAGGVRVAIANTGIDTELYTVRAGEGTEAGTITVSVDVELLSPVRGVELDAAPSELTWVPFDGAVEYTVSLYRAQLMPGKGGSRPILSSKIFLDQRMTEASCPLTQALEDGDYFWWVVAYNASGTKIAESWNYYSSTQALREHIGHFVVATQP